MTTAPTKDKAEHSDIEKLIARADRGDASALPALREAIRRRRGSRWATWRFKPGSRSLGL